jgi:DNA-directed RNA polymerase subunit RPC12/RpoP
MIFTFCLNCKKEIDEKNVGGFVKFKGQKGFLCKECIKSAVFDEDLILMKDEDEGGCPRCSL